MRRFVFLVSLALIVSCIAVLFTYLSPVSSAQDSDRQNQKTQKIERGLGKRMAEDKAGIQRLRNKTNGTAEVKTSEATGAARFVSFAKGKKGDLSRLGKSVDTKVKSREFFNEFGSLFGIKNDSIELRFDTEKVDGQGNKHQTFKQFYKGVPVFAGVLKTHFDNEEQLNAVNGSSIPEIEVDTTPSVDMESAASAAIALVAEQKEVQELTAKSVNLYVYRTGLAQGIPGNDYLVYEIEVTNGSDIRELVYIDAHSNKIVDQFTGIYDALDRRAYNGNNASQANTETIYAGAPFWKEGDAFPTTSSQADNMIISSKETYDFFKNSFNRDSFDGAGTKMDSIFNRGYSCPNASWNGRFISFCSGLTVDDVTAHEWGHAYTQYTHNLIYAWQPGALNEAYSDIWGETVDRINNRDDIGNSASDSTRTSDSCSSNSPTVTRLVINSPAGIAGTYSAQGAAFGPSLSTTLTGNVVQALDAADAAGPTTTDGCSLFTNAAAVAGKIALVDRGTCGFTLKVKNAQVAGATGVIVANNVAVGLPGMGGADPTITIPSLGITQSDGNLVKANLASTVNALLKATPGADASTRWLLGEDSTATGLTGALRDMWNPTCRSNPGKVSDTAYYSCGPNTVAGDNGGVHTNSGVPNHAYALLVDGGTYNGQTVSALGLTKAAHIYFRAMTVYQHSASDFTDHADSLVQAATDLIGVNLNDLVTGTPSGQMITTADVTQIQNAMLAVEMRNPPVQCGFLTLLGQTPPADPSCGVNTVQKTLFADDFEGNTSAWTISRDMASGTFTPRNWSVSNLLPDNRVGKAFYAPDPNSGTCTATGDETGVLHLTSPSIALPGDTVSNRTLTFDHWVATEAGFDGGQLMISVNGGAYTLVPQANFIYNAHNATLATAAAGNTNPRAGQRAWTGADGGSVDGTWGKSMVNLTGLANAGDTIQLRWDMSTDGCGGTFGWYVDNVRVFVCLPDADNDGIPDSQDNCPSSANPNQADNDNDGIGDVCDPDDDNDGVLDTVDNCQFTPNPDQADSDHDGIGDTCDLDNDGDGVNDSVDQCPNTNTAQTKVIIGTGKKSQTGVPNKILASGCSLQQKIDASKVGVKNHGGYVSAVSNLTDQWVSQGIITAAQKDAIMSAVAQDK